MSDVVLVNIGGGGENGKCSMVLAKMWSLVTLGNSSFSGVVWEEYGLVWGLGMN